MSNPNIMPEVTLFPRLRALSDFVVGKVCFLPPKAELRLSEHVRHDELAATGGEFMLATAGEYPDKKSDAGF